MKKQMVLAVMVIMGAALLTGYLGTQRLNAKDCDPYTEANVKVNVDWPEFIARHDMIWDNLPTHFDYGAFLGNGPRQNQHEDPRTRGLRPHDPADAVGRL